MSFLDTMMGIAPPRKIVTPPIALTIAGSDSGGGAGIQADIKTFSALHTHATSVLTLITAQNTRSVSAIEFLPASIVRAQYEAVYDDLPPAAAKTGALGTEAMIGLLIELLQDRPIAKLVVDPVMISKHGDPLMDTAAQRVLREQLLPLASLVTPNRREAEALTGRTVEGPSSMKEAAKRIFDMGAKLVVIKGSHLDRIVRDIVYDGSGFIEFGADRVDSKRVHGSGCVYSAAITARLAHGDEPLQAIEFTRQFISEAIAWAPPLGGGISPVHPMHGLT